MSLKAKIEAVIYASEEPVTLAQLVGLLAGEGEAELEATASRQQRLALQDPTDDDPQGFPDADAEDLNAEVLDSEVLDSEEPSPAEAPEGESSQTEDTQPADIEPKDTEPKDTEPKDTQPAEILSAEPQPAEGESAATGPSGPTPRQKERALRDYFRSLLDELIGDYASEARGLEIREVAGGFRLATKPEYHDAVRGFVRTLKPPLKLSLQALETLAVVAYKQPVTAPEVSEIRGVDSSGVLGSLMTRKLITTAGRKQVIGRPILYKTTKDFLLRFGLKDIGELPSIEEFEKMAGELNAVVQEEIAMDASPGERDETGIEGGTDAAGGETDSMQAGARTGSVEADSLQTGEGPDPEAPDRSSGTASSGSLDELNSAPEPTHMHHDTPEDLMNDKSSAPEGHNREHTDRGRVMPQTEAERQALQPSGRPGHSEAPADSGTNLRRSE